MAQSESTNKSRTLSTNKPRTLAFAVSGMMCENCTSTVRNAAQTAIRKTLDRINIEKNCIISPCLETASLTITLKQTITEEQAKSIREQVIDNVKTVGFAIANKIPKQLRFQLLDHDAAPDESKRTLDNESSVTQSLKEIRESLKKAQYGITINADEDLKPFSETNPTTIEINYQNPHHHPIDLIKTNLIELFSKHGITIQAEEPREHLGLIQLIVLAVGFIATQALHKWIPMNFTWQITIGITTLLLILFGAYQLIKKAGSGLLALMPWLVGLGTLSLLWFFFLPTSGPWLIIGVCLGGILVFGLIMQAFISNSNMYTAQFLSMLILWSTGMIGLCLPQLSLPMPHWQHLLLMVLVLSLTQIFKTHQPKTPQAQNTPRWQMPLYVTKDSNKAQVQTLKEGNKFDLIIHPEDGAIIPLNCHTTKTVWVQAIVSSGELDKYLEIKATKDEPKQLMPGTRVWTSNPSTQNTEIKTINAQNNLETKINAQNNLETKINTQNNLETKINAQNNLETRQPDDVLTLTVDQQIPKQPAPAMQRKKDWVDYITHYFTPFLIFLGVSAGIYAWFMGHAILPTICAMLMCACPCVFCIALPLINKIAITRLAQQQLDPNPAKGNSLELLLLLHQVSHVVIDKTGTLTYGRRQATTSKEHSASTPALRDNAKNFIQDMRKLFGDEKITILTGDPEFNPKREGKQPKTSIEGLKLHKAIQIEYSDNKQQHHQQHFPGQLIFHLGDGDNDRKSWLTPSQNDKKSYPRVISASMPQSWDTVQTEACFRNHNKEKPLLVILELFKIAKWTHNFRQCCFGFAAVYNLIAIPLTFLGYIPPMTACLMMCGSSLFLISILYIANWYYKPHVTERKKPTGVASNPTPRFVAPNQGPSTIVKNLSKPDHNQDLDETALSPG